MADYTIDFAVACEGATDYAVLKNILLGFCKGQPREPRISRRQPLSDATGEAAWQQFGNWENVFRFLREGLHRQALEFSEYLVVQVDSDQSEHANFGVPQRDAGSELSAEAMVAGVSAKLREIIGPDDCAAFGGRIIFAVCVRDIECWLLPLWEIDNKTGKTTGCLATLNAALKRAHQTTINPDQKMPDRYHKVSGDFRKRSILIKEGPKNPSLALFLAELEKRSIALVELE